MFWGRKEMLWPTGWKIPKPGILGTDLGTAEEIEEEEETNSQQKQRGCEDVRITESDRCLWR